MLNIFENCAVFELCLMEKKKKKMKKKKIEAEIRKKMNEIEIFMLGFFDFAKG